MQFKNAFSVTLCNIPLIYKLLISFLVIILIGVALTVSIAHPVVMEINSAFDSASAVSRYELVISDPLEFVTEYWKTLTTYFSLNVTQIIVRFLFLFLTIIFMRFMLSLSIIPTAKILYVRMTTGCKNNFIPTLVASLKQTIPFAILSAVIIGTLDMCLFILSVWLITELFAFINIFAIVFGLPLMLLLFSARICIFSQWAAVICEDEKNPFVALAKGFKQSTKTFWNQWPLVFTTLLISTCLILSMSLLTFGIVVLIVVPIAVIMITALGLTAHFKMLGKKYYTDNGMTIYEPDKE